MKKIDLKKELKHLYQPSAKGAERVEIPTMNYLMMDGEGDPNTSVAFKEAVEVLFAVSYTLKFMIKKGKLAIDYGVMPLEGLWWADDMSRFNAKDKSRWNWTLMIMQPECIKKDMIDVAIAEVKKKKNPVALPKVRFEGLSEGVAAQTMHVGPFSKEGPTIKSLHEFIARLGFKRAGKHHEIYLSDIRKGDPKKWKTVIRQPMK